MKIINKIAVPTIIGTMLLSGSVFAANQSATAVLGLNSSEVESNRINNNSAGNVTATGYLNAGSPNYAIMEIKRTVQYFPDEQLAQTTLTSTTSKSISGSSVLIPTLFYVELNRQIPGFKADATATIRNY